MVGNETLDFKSLGIEEQMTSTARGIFENMKMRIEKIQKSTQELEEFSEVVRLRVINSASKLADIKFDKAVEEKIVDQRSPEQLKHLPSELSTRKNWENVKQTIMDSRFIIQPLSTPVIFESTNFNNEETSSITETINENKTNENSEEIKTISTNPIYDQFDQPYLPPAPSIIDFKPIVPIPTEPLKNELFERMSKTSSVETHQTQTEQTMPQDDVKEKNNGVESSERINTPLDVTSQKIEVVQKTPNAFNTRDTAKAVRPTSVFDDSSSESDGTEPTSSTVDKKLEKEKELLIRKVDERARHLPEVVTTNEIISKQSAVPSANPIPKKSIFSSDSDSEADTIQKLTSQKEQNKPLPSKFIVKNETSRLDSPKTSLHNLSIRIPQKKSLFDDSDSDSDLFSVTSKLNITTSRRTVKQNMEKKQEEEERLIKNVTEKKENDYNTHKQTNCDILKNRTRGPSNRRPPTLKK